MKIRFIVLFICIFVLCGCGTNKFHREEVPLGRLISDPFDSEEYTHGEVCIKEIEEEEYNLLNGLNTIGDLKGDNVIRKYCSLQLTYYDIKGNEIRIDIHDLKYVLGTPSMYRGNIEFEHNGKQSGGITIMAETTGIVIATSIYTDKNDIIGVYIMEKDMKFPLGKFVSDSIDHADYPHTELCIKEIEEEEYNLLNGLNSIIVLKKDNTIRKYCLLQFTYYDAEGNEMKIDIKDLECSLGTVNIYHGNIVFEDNEKPSVGITMIIGFTALRIITNTDSYESIILKLY